MGKYFTCLEFLFEGADLDFSLTDANGHDFLEFNE